MIDMNGALEMLDGDDFSDLDGSDLDPDYNGDGDCRSTSSSDLDDGVEECPQTHHATSASDIAPEESSAETFCSAEQTLTKRSRKRQSDPKAWKRNERKRARNAGKCHVNSKGKERAERKPQSCDCQRCRFKCNEYFSEEMRNELCKEYWQLGDYKRQKDFLLARAKIQNVQRFRARGERKRLRKNAVVYTFNSDGTEKRVCKKFFLKTLNISGTVVSTALKGRGDGGSFTGEDERGKQASANKTSQDRIDLIKEHIESFPTVESHYTRKDTKRLYLNQNLSIRKMYRLYVEKCQTADPPIDPVKQNVYRKVFCNEYNLSFFKPRKDQCVTCVRYFKASPSEKEKMKLEYEEHIRRKNESQAAKAADKERSMNVQEFVSASFDLQSVLQLPASDVSLLYYCRKLCVYNLCIYEPASQKKGSCYCWSEVEGNRGSNEIGTCLYKWLEQLPVTAKEVSLYSDTCGGQNRNQNVAALFLYAVQKLDIDVITHNFLESGHSMMECDSMHSAIEKEKRYRDVYTMTGWAEIFRRARRQNPYKVTTLHHGDIFKLQQIAQTILKNRRKDEEGNVVNWLLVKSFRYEKCEPGVIFYKYNYSDNYKKMYVFGRGKPVLPDELPPAYGKRIEISSAKKNDLLKLCRQHIIPEELHFWYSDLPSSSRVLEHIPEPCVEDSGPDDDTD